MPGGRPSARPPDVFEAIAHPVRRRLLDQLMAGEQAAGMLAAEHEMSRPAVSQHLQILREAGLVTERRAGRARLYRLQPEGLCTVRDWLVAYEQFWQGKLGALEQYLKEQHGA